MRGAILLGACLLLASSPLTADDLPSLARDFWSWRAVHQPITSDDIPRISRPHGWAPDWSPGRVDALRGDLLAFGARYRAVASLPRPAPEEIDYRLLGSALERVHWELDVVRSWRRDPGFYVAQTLGALVDVLLPSSPFTPERSADVVTRLSSFPRTLGDGRANLDEAVRPFAHLAIEDLGDIGPRLRTAMGALRPLLAEGSRPRLDAETERACAALEGYRAWLQSKEGQLPDPVALGRENYLFFLHKVALMPFTPEQVQAMGRQEWARSVTGEALEKQRNQGLAPLPL
ncbi:MAG TPA: DUF885 family protein, partial [Vicinamibacteria bacterium]|nr:DUF885 family protein [Vicinamibacteria bacterium]